MPAHRNRPAPWYRWAIGIAVVGLVVIVVEHRGEPRKFAHVLANARPAWLIAAALLQAGTYASIAVIWKAVLRRARTHAPHIMRLMRLSVAELFTDQVIPSGGMSGTMLVVSSLKRRQVPKRAATAAVVSSLAGFYIAQLVLVVASLFVLWLKHLGGWEATTGLIALGAAIVMPLPLVAALFAARKVPRRLRRIRAICEVYVHMKDVPKDVVFSPGILATSTGFRALVFLLDGMTLVTCLAAVGTPMSPAPVIAAYIVAFVVGSASFLPGGIGTFEAAVVALLVGAGAPLEAAVPATLLMRALSFWLPMIPGVLFAHHEVAGRAEPTSSPG